MIKINDTHLLEALGYLQEIMRSLDGIHRKVGDVFYKNSEAMDERIEELIKDQIDDLERRIEYLEEKLGLADNFISYHTDQFRDIVKEAYTQSLLYGHSKIQLTWDENDQTIRS